MGNRKSNIYTRRGDKGETSLLGGKRIAKIHPRIEAYGTVDELMAHTALLRDYTQDEDIKVELLKVLGMLMSSASVLASDGENMPVNMPKVTEEDIVFLEGAIDRMDAVLGPLTNFVLPGGGIEVSQAHVARTVCRRAERIILSLAEFEEVEDIILRFFNRLSDYYFQITRILADIKGVDQESWKP